MSRVNPVPGWIGRVRSWAPDRVAVASRDGAALTYAELDTRSDRLVNALLAHGLAPGDAVGLWMDDQIGNVEMYLAAAKGGFVLVPVNERFQPPEAEYILSTVDVRAVLYCDSVADRLSTLDTGAVLLNAGSARLTGAHDFGEFVAAGSTAAVAGPLPEDAPYLIAFSSGTTGYPKGAVLTGRSVGEIAVMSAISRQLEFYGLGLVTTSVSFAASIMATILTLLYAGNSMVLMGRGWDHDELLRMAAERRATYLTVSSPHFTAFAEAARRNPAGLASVRSIVHGGSKVPREQVAALVDAVGDRFVEVWGMVEHSGGPLTTTVPADFRPGCPAEDIMSSVGRLLPQCELRIGNAEPDGVGELVVRSPALMDGYLKRPQETAAALRDGWYHTGDLGRVDGAGYVYIVDRRNDLIVSGGMNIYPSEVERALEECPGVREAVVVGLPHPRWGRSPAAVLVVEPGARVSAGDVLGFLAGQLASYKKPTRLAFVPELPRNASGKVVRREVRAILEAQPTPS